MTMPSSGTITMQQINVELRRSNCVAQISLDTAENGGYGAINTNSRSYPRASNPAALSEWYGYDHRAVGTPTYAPMPEVGYAGNTSTLGRALDDACRNSVSSPGRYWGNEGQGLVETASTSDFYTNSTGTAFPPAGYYAQFGTEAIYWNGSSPTRIEICRI